MEKIDWCLNQKKGIKIVQVNDNLSNSYIDDADNSLLSLDKVGGKWKLIMGYYSCYNALYSILMKAGIKSEIHDCTINLMKFIDNFSKEDYNFMKNLKQNRIDSQYYLKEKKIDLKKVKDFVLKCKIILQEFDFENFRKVVMSYSKN